MVWAEELLYGYQKDVQVGGVLVPPAQGQTVQKTVTDTQCCGYGMFIPDPDFCPSKNSNKKEGWKKFVVLLFFVATNNTKLKYILFWTGEEKKFGPFYLFTQKIVIKLSGSGVKKAPDPGSATLMVRYVPYRYALIFVSYIIKCKEYRTVNTQCVVKMQEAI